MIFIKDVKLYLGSSAKCCVVQFCLLYDLRPGLLTKIYVRISKTLLLGIHMLFIPWMAFYIRNSRSILWIDYQY